MKMRKKRKCNLYWILVPLIAIAAIFLLRRNIALTDSQAASLAQIYFKENYNLSIAAVGQIGQERVGQNSYLVTVQVYDEYHNEYILIFDRNGHPLADNMYAVQELKAFNVDHLKTLLPDGLIQKSQPHISFDWEKGTYISSLSLTTVLNPSDISSDKLYDLFLYLTEIGIDQIWINVAAPPFLSERHTNGIVITAEAFDLSVKWPKFEEMYCTFQENTYWNEQNFGLIRTKLERIGCENVEFRLSKVTASTVTIQIQAKIPKTVLRENIDKIISGIDESYFRVNNRNVVIELEDRGAVPSSAPS